MRYSAYVILNAIVAFVAFLIVAAIFLSLPSPAGVGLLVVFGLLLLLGFGMSVAWRIGP